MSILLSVNRQAYFEITVDYNNPQFVSVSVDITDGKVTYVSIG